jgi:hypothetical protein
MRSALDGATDELKMMRSAPDGATMSSMSSAPDGAPMITPEGFFSDEKKTAELFRCSRWSLTLFRYFVFY